MTQSASNDFTPTLRATPGLGDFFRGLGLPFKAIGLVFRSRKLFVLTLISSVVTLVALVGLVALLGTSTDNLLGYFWTQPQTWYGSALWHLVLALAFVILLVVGANTVPLILLAPLQDPISEATEALCGGLEAEPLSLAGLLRGASVSLAHTLKRVIFLLGGHLVLVPLNFIPGVGSVLWTVLGVVWTVWWLAGEYLSAPMARHLHPFAAVRRALWARKALAAGFGAAVYLLLWVPILNLFFIPLAIIGGTLMFRALRTAGHIPAPVAPRLP